jgi:hypothetical protein
LPLFCPGLLCDYLPTATPETKRVEKVKEQTPIIHTPEDSESDSPQPVRPQRQRQPPLRFGYNAPGCPTGEFPFIWQDPNVGLVQIRDPWFGPPWIGPIPVPWMSPIQNPMFHAQVMNPMISPPPFGYYPTY